MDKTAFALKLIEEGSHYFLSRPRRFGKSLFLDTVAELLAGSEALFMTSMSFASSLVVHHTALMADP